MTRLACDILIIGSGPAGYTAAVYAARAALGPDRVLGISVADPGQARVAEVAGADYLGVTVWSTATKPEAVGEGDGVLRVGVQPGQRVAERAAEPFGIREGRREPLQAVGYRRLPQRRRHRA